MCKDLSSSQISPALPKPNLNKLGHRPMMASAAGKVSLKPRRPRESFRICRLKKLALELHAAAPDKLRSAQQANLARATRAPARQTNLSAPAFPLDVDRLQQMTAM